jgi:septal ring factor EnvC (AmiA/AmiB activator)
MTAPRTTQNAALAAITSKLDEIQGAITSMERRMAVHDETHRRLDNEHISIEKTLQQHNQAIAHHDKKLSQIENDMIRLTSNLNKFFWVVVTPIITAAVLALLYVAAGGVK